MLRGAAGSVSAPRTAPCVQHRLELHIMQETGKHFNPPLEDLHHLTQTHIDVVKAPTSSSPSQGLRCPFLPQQRFHSPASCAVLQPVLLRVLRASPTPSSRRLPALRAARRPPCSLRSPSRSRLRRREGRWRKAVGQICGVLSMLLYVYFSLYN